MKKILIKNRILIFVLIVSVLTRVVAALFLGNEVVNLPGTFDQISYHNLALRLISGHGFSFGETWWPITPANAPTAHWSFLYTLYLAAVYLLFGPDPIIARIIQAVITGILHPYLAYKIGDQLFSRKVGLVSAVLTVVYAYFVYYDATLMTEPFFITLVMACLYLSIKIVKEASNIGRQFAFSRKMIYLTVLFGLCLGGAVLLRQLIMILIPVFYLWIIWVNRKYNFKGDVDSFIY